MALGEKFWKEIRGGYNQEVAWVQIMTDCRARHRASRNRAPGCRVSQIIHPQNWPLWDKCTIYESDSGRQKELTHWGKLPVSLRCCWADSDFFVFCSNSFDPPDPDLWRFFAFSGHAKLLSRELPENIVGWYPPPHHIHSWTSHIYSRGCSRWCQQCHIETDVTFPSTFFSFEFCWKDVKMARPVIIVEILPVNVPKTANSIPHHNSLFILAIFALDCAVTLLQHNSDPCNVIIITVDHTCSHLLSLHITSLTG